MSRNRLDEHGCELAYCESDCIAVAALVLDTVTTREEATMMNTDPQTSDDYWSHYLEVWQADAGRHRWSPSYLGTLRRRQLG
jgi:hypothetical protein